jgi:hypothetical protein
VKAQVPIEDNGDSTAIVNVVTGSGPNPEPVRVLLVVFDEPIFLEPLQLNEGDMD